METSKGLSIGACQMLIDYRIVTVVFHRCNVTVVGVMKQHSNGTAVVRGVCMLQAATAVHYFLDV